ncbi:MAG: hypothetical protein HOQ36_17115 [Nocardia sp.]|nr:hypothetical protein [Nocardia sp.]
MRRSVMALVSLVFAVVTTSAVGNTAHAATGQVALRWTVDGSRVEKVIDNPSGCIDLSTVGAIGRVSVRNLTDRKVKLWNGIGCRGTYGGGIEHGERNGRWGFPDWSIYISSQPPAPR